MSFIYKFILIVAKATIPKEVIPTGQSQILYFKNLNKRTSIGKTILNQAIL